MIKFIVILALIAVSVQAYPAEEPVATVEIHPREVVPEEGDVAVVPDGVEENEEGLKPSESAHWGYGGGWGGGWRGGWGGGWGGGWRRGWGGGWGGYGGGWGGRGYGGWRHGGWGYPHYHYW